jgi:hypothetical protein
MPAVIRASKGEDEIVDTIYIKTCCAQPWRGSNAERSFLPATKASISLEINFLFLEIFSGACPGLFRSFVKLVQIHRCLVAGGLSKASKWGPQA